jgi:hypothetical protein
MLNVWHLVAFQRYYDGLIAATTPAAAGQQARPQQQQLATAAAAAQRLNASGSNIMEVSAGRPWQKQRQQPEPPGSMLAFWPPRPACHAYKCFFCVPPPLLPFLLIWPAL